MAHNMVSKDPKEREAAQAEVARLVTENCPASLKDYATVIRMGHTILALNEKIEKLEASKSNRLGALDIVETKE